MTADLCNSLMAHCACHVLQNGTELWINSAPYAGRGALTYAINRHRRPELQYMAYRMCARRTYPEYMWQSVLSPTAGGLDRVPYAEPPCFSYRRALLTALPSKLHGAFPAPPPCMEAAASCPPNASTLTIFGPNSPPIGMGAAPPFARIAVTPAL